MNWLRLWHEMPTDPKWRVIAKRSNQSIPTVIAVYNFVLVNASSNEIERGSLSGWNSEDVAACLDIKESDVDAVIEAMQGKVLEGQRVTGWEKRQPKREDSSTERVREFRKRNETQRNAPEKRREEKTREEDKPPIVTPLGDEREKPKPRIQHEFDEDWPRFWLRVGKGSALKAYEKARKKVSREVLMAAVVEHGPHILARAQAQDITPVHPATWMNAERWTDEIRAPSLVPIKKETAIERIIRQEMEKTANVN